MAPTSPLNIKRAPHNPASVCIDGHVHNNYVEEWEKTDEFKNEDPNHNTTHTSASMEKNLFIAS